MPTTAEALVANIAEALRLIRITVRSLSIRSPLLFQYGA